MKRRELLAALALAAIGEVSCSQAQENQARCTREIARPKPKAAGAISLQDVLQRRRSVRPTCALS